MTTYSLTGQVFARYNGRSLPGVRVEVHDNDGAVTGLVALTQTDADGTFKVSLEDDYLKELFGDRLPTLTLRLFSNYGSEVGWEAHTFRYFIWKLTTFETTARIEVDTTTYYSGAHSPTESIVRGVLRNAAGSPIADATVRAFDRNLDRDEDVGEGATTDYYGRYQITYLSFNRGEKVRPDLVVRATDSSGTTLVESDRICNAPAFVTVDLTVGGAYLGPSEYEVLKARVDPRTVDFDLGEADDESIGILACSARADRAHVTTLRDAVAIAGKSDLDVELVYGLIRKGMPSTRRELLSTRQAELMAALDAAIADNTVPRTFANLEAIEHAKAALRQAAINLALESPPSGATCSLGDVLGTVLTTSTLRQQFLALYLDHTGTQDAFWTALAANATFTAHAANLEFALQAASLTRHHFPLIKELQARRGTSFSTLSDLASYTEQDWLDAINHTVTGGGIIGYPSDTPGSTVAAKKANYAKVLKSTMEAAFPTESIKFGLAQNLPVGAVDPSSFFDHNPGFQFGKTRFADYLTKNPTALSAHYGSSMAEEVAKQVSAVERLFRVTPKHSQMKLFLDDGHTSALSLVRLGKDAFVEKYQSGLGGVIEAELMFTKAQHAAHHALALHTRYSPQHNPKLGYAHPDYKPSGATEPAAIADYQTLFGSADACECEHCSSVYSPAAYLVDLLQFLMRYPSNVTKSGSTKWTAREILIGNRPGLAQPPSPRRTDIGWLALDCDNTDIPIPYVDLVNEILEHALAASPPPYAAMIETTGSAADLAALPEILPQEAAPRLSAYAALATAVHPFTAPFHLWCEEARLYLQHLGVPRWRLMQILASTTADFEARALIAAERLGLSPRERSVVTGDTSLGLGAHEYWGFASAGAMSGLHAVPTFLARAGIEYDELLQLVETRYLADYEITLTPGSGGDPCNPDTMVITFGSHESDGWDAIHRFLRLRRCLGYSIVEADQAVSAMGGVITDTCLMALAVVERLRAEWQMPIPVLTSWFGNLDTQRRDGGKVPSYYDQIFQNKAVRTNPDPGLDVHAAGFPAVGDTLAAHEEAIRSALRISASEFALLTDPAVGLAELGPPNDDPIVGPGLTLKNLSKLHRIVTFSRALGLSIADFLRLGRLSGTLDQTSGSTDGFDPDEVERFLDVVARVQSVGVTPSDLAYLLSRQVLPGATIVPDMAAIDATLKELYAGLLKIQSEPKSADAILDASKRLVRQTLATSLDLPLGTASVLLDMLLTKESSSEPLLNAFLLPSSPPATMSSANLAAQERAYLHLHVSATLVRTLDLTEDEAMTLGGFLLVFDNLPRTPTTASPSLFTTWKAAADVRAFRNTLPHADQGFITIYKAATSASPGAEDTLAAETGWSSAEVSTLLTRLGLTLGAPATLADVATAVLRLADVFTALKRLGVSADKAITWTDTTAPLPGGSGDTADKIADAIVQAAKSKYDASEWQGFAPDLRDVLREKQRKALVSQLVSKRGYTTSDELFADLLVDVETAPGQVTSRIKQAIGSVQSFVQRALLNLEPSVQLPDEAAHTWTWMKSYRVWEANRKVFLYPENWIEPTLRDDKSPFFLAMENELRQKEITNDAAEAAFQRYLEKLEEVGALDVVAMYHQKEAAEGLHPSIDVLHVIGRTRSEPYKHFYRRRLDATQWTPWELIDLDIEGDHVIFAIMNRRPHILWPLIEEKASPREEQPKGSVDEPGSDAKSHLEIRLAWSEFRSKKWSARKVSVGNPLKLEAAINAQHPLPTTQYLSFEPELDDKDADLKITCLLDLGYWGVKSAKRVRVGSFVLDACGGNIEGRNEALQLVINGPTTYAAAGNHSTEPGGMWVTPVAPGDSRPYYQRATATNGGLKMPLVLYDMLGQELIFRDTPSTYRVLTPHQIGYPNAAGADLPEAKMFFYMDRGRTYFAELERRTWTFWSQASKAFPGQHAWFSDDGRGYLPRDPSSNITPWARQAPQDNIIYIPYEQEDKQYRFFSFYHPYACLFLKELNRSGVDGLLKWSLNPSDPIQLRKKDDFEHTYDPTDNVLEPYPIEEVDFSLRGAYSLYNWELFFHAPFLIATRLTANQRFEEAQRWFHFIFDPTSGGKEKAPARFWKVKPFRENLDLATIEDEILNLSPAERGIATQLLVNLLQAVDEDENVKDLHAQIEAWRKNPFNPHLIARMRPIAYQKAVFVRYVQNLLAWGDQLFRRDTIEAINEATQLYILAAGILGKRPRRVKRNETPDPETYWDLDEAGLDDLSDAIVQSEGLTKVEDDPVVVGGVNAPPPDLRELYFCVPPNDALLVLWDTVADRLFKIRHSMNIEGVVRMLPLFEPPIDPALLVQATALGVDLATALDDATAPVPLYRFSVMHAKAAELCSSVVSLGGAFLSVLEKKDAEGLARLRSGHEVEMLKLVRDTKKKQVKEAEANLTALEKQLDVVKARHDHYRQIAFISDTETTALATAGTAAVLGAIGQGLATSVPGVQHIPTITFGTAGTFGSPVTLNVQGGEIEASAVSAAAQAVNVAAGLLREEAQMISTLASYERRFDEWKLQERLAAREITQIQKQIAAAKIRIAIAEADLAHHERQIEQTQEVDDYLRDKFTNEDLYDRMVTQLSTVYFEAYKLAYDVAKRAEKAYKYELALDSMSANMVTFGYWDSLKQGLLAGEQLQHDLKRLELSYLEKNAREYEITKHVSLAELDPDALLTLRETGTCDFEIKEAHFDADFPGHYVRRIKSVGITLPAVTGPYTGVHCTMTLLSGKYRNSTSLVGGYAEGASDGRFTSTTGTTSVVTSSAQADAGLFEVNLRDERYLPFEGAGANSTWRVSVPKSDNGFDVSAIDDVILHVRYTARDSQSPSLKSAAAANKPLKRRILSARSEFPNEWAAFMNPAGSAPQVLTFPLDGSCFPYVVPTTKVILSNVKLYARWRGKKNYAVGTALSFTLFRPGISDPVAGESRSFAAGTTNNLGATAQINLSSTAERGLGAWTVSVSTANVSAIDTSLKTAGRLDDSLQDIWFVCEYDTTAA
ncbi:MAG: neuraminidase-like domain-containing protein [Minicystis sp.]